MYHGWFRLCLSADGSTATAGEWGAPAPGHLPFWFKPVSAFGLLEITAFISSSPGLAMPPTLAPDRLGASSRRVLSRETRPPGSGEVSLSQELRTVGLLRPHVLVEYQWSHTGLCPGCRPVITATSAASCHTPSFSGHGYPTRCAANTCCPHSDRFWLLELRVSRHFSTFYGPSVQSMDTQLGARQGRRTPTIHRGRTQRTISAGSLAVA